MMNMTNSRILMMSFRPVFTKQMIEKIRKISLTIRTNKYVFNTKYALLISAFTGNIIQNNTKPQPF